MKCITFENGSLSEGFDFQGQTQLLLGSLGPYASPCPVRLDEYNPPTTIRDRVHDSWIRNLMPKDHHLSLMFPKWTLAKPRAAVENNSILLRINTLGEFAKIRQGRVAFFGPGSTSQTFATVLCLGVGGTKKSDSEISTWKDMIVQMREGAMIFALLQGRKEGEGYVIKVHNGSLSAVFTTDLRL